MSMNVGEILGKKYEIKLMIKNTVHFVHHFLPGQNKAFHPYSMKKETH